MKDEIRVFLIEPVAESRQALERTLREATGARLVESCGSYQGAARRAAELAPDLALVALDHDPEQAIGLIQELRLANPLVEVLPASGILNSALILRAVRAGAREFLTLPLLPAEWLETTHRLFSGRSGSRAAVPRGPQVIALAGAAGGVGCTSLAVNLGSVLAKTSGHEIALVDFDLMLGSVDAWLDVVSDCSLLGLVQNLDRLDPTLLKRSMVRHSSGLHVLPHPIAMEDAARIEPESLRKVITVMKAGFPTVVIDTSKGLQSTDFVAYEMADVIVLVLQLDLICLRNTARLLQLFHQMDGMARKVILVANRVGTSNTEISLKKAQETLKMPIDYQIPNAYKEFQAAQARGVPADVVAPGSKVHQAVLQLARPLRPFPAPEVSKPKRGFFAALF